MIRLLTLLTLLTLLILLPAIGCRTADPPQTVPSVNLERYTGLWYQIARYPHFFQTRDCALSTARYTLREDGTILVENRCWKDQVGGTVLQKADAEARPADETGAHLKVQFFPLFTADYLIIALDEENYQWAAVSTPDRESLWILSRRPSLEPELFRRLLRDLTNRGCQQEKILLTSRQAEALAGEQKTPPPGE